MSDTPEQSVNVGGEEWPIVHSYNLDQAIADGMLVEPFDNRCYYSQPPKRLVMTAAIARDFDHLGLQAIWDAWLEWVTTAHQLPEEEQLFSKEFNGKRVWVIEDDVSICIMHPEDY